MAYNNLVVNGCSYMEAYVSGLGHADLSQRLGISQVKSLARGGSANSRIIRTTLKHSYNTDNPTFYVLGLTFLSRLEIPILENKDEFEGRWTNPQNQDYSHLWQHDWNKQDTETFVDIKLKTEIYSILDRVEDLMYRILSMIADLRSRNHQVLIYQQADTLHLEHLSNPRLRFFQNNVNIIDGYSWRAVPWQLQQGVPPTNYGSNPLHHIPDDIKHPAPGHHHKLNEFLVDYITSRNMLNQ